MKKPTTNGGRPKDRIVKAISFPIALHDRLQNEANNDFGTDFTRAVFENLAHLQEMKDFLDRNPNAKPSGKKFPGM